MIYYQQLMAYWISNNAVMCRLFLISLGETTLRWFTRLLVGKINNFRELAKQFTVRFITNSRIIKGLEVLTSMRKKKGDTLCESQRGSVKRTKKLRIMISSFLSTLSSAVFPVITMLFITPSPDFSLTPRRHY